MARSNKRARTSSVASICAISSSPSTSIIDVDSSTDTETNELPNRIIKARKTFAARFNTDKLSPEEVLSESFSDCFSI